MKIKRLLAGLITTTMVFGLAACGGGGNNNSSNNNNSNSNSNSSSGTQNNTSNASTNNDSGSAASEGTSNFSGKTLTVGVWGGNDQEEAALQKVKADFEAKTGAKIDFKVYTDYNTQIQADFIGKTAPDVFYMNADTFEFYSRLGVLEVLDRNEMQADKFYSNLIDAFVADGQLMAIPKDVSTLAMYYNIDILDSVGMTADDIPEALEDFAPFLIDLQAKLDEKYGKGQIAAMTYNQDLARNLHLLERNGASVTGENGNSTLSSDGIMKNLEFMMSLIETGAYKTPGDIGLGWNGEVMGTGKCAIMEEGNWVYGSLRVDFSDINFGVKDMPSYLGQKSSMSFTVGYSIYSGSKEKELAKEWIKYATGLEGMATWTLGAGCLPSRGDVADAIDINSDPVWAVHSAQTAYAMPWQIGVNGNIINTSYRNFMPSAVKGDMSLKEAMQKADEQANNEIANSH